MGSHYASMANITLEQICIFSQNILFSLVTQLLAISDILSQLPVWQWHCVFLVQLFHISSAGCGSLSWPGQVRLYKNYFWNQLRFKQTTLKPTYFVFLNLVLNLILKRVRLILICLTSIKWWGNRMFAPHWALIVFSIFDNTIIWGEGVG